MTRLSRRLIVAVVLLAGSMDARTRIHLPPPSPPADIFSSANVAAVRTEHLTLDLTIDFAARRLRGSATHHIVNEVGAREMVFDTRGLEISSVSVDGAQAQWQLGQLNAFGRPLTVAIDPTSRVIRIDYQSGANASGIQWFEPSQTTGRVRQAMFIQGQPDHTRSWVPIQDTPGVRITWDATLRVPEGILPLMSAASNPQQLNDSGIYHFEQRRSVPPYLMVMSAGRFAFHPLSERSGIYAEPELLEDAVYEMQFLPEMIEVAERIFGPYPWDRYDLLFPPHFGGGMENTNLNFIAPGVISRNRPDPVLPHGIIAHELAHSWVGDMVTCGNWSDLWLNEGSATYYEKRILEEMSGLERAEIGYFFDRRAFEQYLADARPAARLTTMHRTFAGKEGPGSVFNIVSYQKGELFLKMLEDNLGRTRFDAMMADYLRRHAFSWVDDRAFLAAIERALEGEPASFIQSLKIQEWVYEGGLPSNVTAPNTSAMWDRMLVESNRFRQGTPASDLPIEEWTALEESLFLQQIMDTVPARLHDLDAGFGFSGRMTPPNVWLLGIAKTRDAQLLPVLENYLMRGDSNSLNIWYEFGQTFSGRQYGLGLYQRARPYYSDNARAYIEAVLQPMFAKPEADAAELEPAA